MPRFRIGDFIELNGLLGEINGGAIGIVVSVVPNKHSISALDEYTVAFKDSRVLRFWSFQLTPAAIDQRHAALYNWRQR